MTATNTAQAIAGEQAQKTLRRLTFEINQVVKSCAPDRVHDLRVAIRRFSQGLKVFKPSFAGKDVRRIRRRLKRFLAAAGEVRNRDVVLRLLSKVPGAASNPLGTELEAQRRECKRELLGVLRPWSQGKSSLRWRAALLTAKTEPDFGTKPISEIAQGVLPRMAKNMFSRGRKVAGATTAKDLHELRIAVKKVRYTLELFAPYFSDHSVGRLQASLKLIQTSLGDINDCETAREMIAGQQGCEHVEAWLKKRQQRKTQEFRRDWEKYFGDHQAQQAWFKCLNNFAPQPSATKKPVGASRTATARFKTRPAAVA